MEAAPDPAPTLTYPTCASRPPVIAVKDGKARIIVRRETEDDLRMLDI